MKNPFKLSLAKRVKAGNTAKLIHWYAYIPALLSNFFSVAFSCTIVFKLKDFLNTNELIFLAIFVIFFIITNEVFKVKEIRKVFAGNKNALVTFAITFIISVSLATIGIYYYTNKANDIRDNSTVQKTIALNEISKRYNESYAKIVNSTFENTKEYETLNNELKYWKKSSPATIDERTYIRTKIDNLQTVIQKQRDLYNQEIETQKTKLLESTEVEKSIVLATFDKDINKTKSNNFLTYIFLTLILITEFGTIILQKNIVEKSKVANQFLNSKIAKLYLLSSNILTSLYLVAKNNIVTIQNAQYSLANKDNVLSWEEICQLYNSYIALGILDKGKVIEETGKKILHNTIILPEHEAQKKLDEYFERFLTL